MATVAARPGRPPHDADDHSVAVCVRLPSRVFDAVYQRAQRERVTMPEVLRRALDRELQESEDE